ncbi:MAG: hypothetical protein U0U67_14595 [Chitinophagales bacterium]
MVKKGIVAGKVVGADKGIKWNNKLENIMILDQIEAIIFCEECGSRRFFAPWAGDFSNAKELGKSIRRFNLKTDFVDRTDIVEDSIATIKN